MSDLLEHIPDHPTPSRLRTFRDPKRMSSETRIYARALPFERQAVINRVIELLGDDCTTDEIADELRYSLRHTRRLIHRARRRIAEAEARERSALPRAASA